MVVHSTPSSSALSPSNANALPPPAIVGHLADVHRSSRSNGGLIGSFINLMRQPLPKTYVDLRAPPPRVHPLDYVRTVMITGGDPSNPSSSSSSNDKISGASLSEVRIDEGFASTTTALPTATPISTSRINGDTHDDEHRGLLNPEIDISSEL